MCRASPQKKEALFLSFTQIGIFDGLLGCVYPLVPMTKHACRMALASNIQKYTFKMALGPCKQCIIMFSEGFKVSRRSDI